MRVTLGDERTVFGEREANRCTGGPRRQHGPAASVHEDGDTYLLRGNVRFMNVVPWERYIQPIRYLVFGWVLGRERTSSSRMSRSR